MMNNLRKWLVDVTHMPLGAADLLFALSNIGAIAGGVLVVVGTAGIFFFGSVREHYASVTQAELESRTAEARRDAASAIERAAQLNKDSEAVRLELERERKERLELERRMAPRRISTEMRDQIRQLVPPDNDTKLHVKVAMNNAEGDRLINELGAACLDAGWPRNRIDGTTCAGVSFPEGLTVAVNPQESQGNSAWKTAIGLVTVITNAGLASAPPLRVDPEVPVGTVVIAAGLKPDVV
jgi:hypothetical protein